MHLFYAGDLLCDAQCRCWCGHREYERGHRLGAIFDNLDVGCKYREPDAERQPSNQCHRQRRGKLHHEQAFTRSVHAVQRNNQTPRRGVGLFARAHKPFDVEPSFRTYNPKERNVALPRIGSAVADSGACAQIVDPWISVSARGSTRDATENCQFKKSQLASE
jgi:hypothetical protein